MRAARNAIRRIRPIGLIRRTIRISLLPPAPLGEPGGGELLAVAAVVDKPRLECLDLLVEQVVGPG